MLKLLNINDHPTNRNKKVFFFQRKELAEHFELELQRNNIVYEKQIDTEGDQTIYIGIRKNDFALARHLNYLTYGKFRKPMIQSAYFRYLLVIVFVVCIILACIGAIIANA